ncbi:DNA polymerase IV [Thiomonas sp. X19]|uniref:DNA polymerase IV n=1 Tax=Thiomonas sp. X19 TaxID=1050370 RepID=UPI000DDBA015|nr:DNA polymerase IV [Thiomonas sp. X19]
MNPRRIAHLDMDAFFASVELLRYPELRGLPVVVGGRHDWHPTLQPDGSHRFARLRQYVGRGVVTTSTYEARAFGVFSGMGMMKAAQLAPDAILLPANFEAYRHHSALFKAAVARIAPQIEDRGIDEIYIDLTDLPGESHTLAVRIKQAVHAATGLSCSIGITPNKLLSKMASELDKPDGITILSQEDVPSRIGPLAASKVGGIGPKATLKLKDLGVHTLADLAGADAAVLQQHFGATYAAWLQDVAQGIDDRPVVTVREPKSVSRETTFERDLHPRHDRAALSAVFTELCQRLAGDLQRKGLVSRTIGIKLRFEDFRTVTRDLSLDVPTDEAQGIRRAAGQCLKRIEMQGRIRLLGVRAAALMTVQDLEHSGPSLQRQLALIDGV